MQVFGFVSDAKPFIPKEKDLLLSNNVTKNTATVKKTTTTGLLGTRYFNMKTSVNIQSQYDYCDGECIMNFYCIDVNDKQITVAVQRLGHVFLDTYQLFDDNNGKYFEYGVMCDRIYLDEFYN